MSSKKRSSGQNYEEQCIRSNLANPESGQQLIVTLLSQKESRGTFLRFAKLYCLVNLGIVGQVIKNHKVAFDKV